MVCYTNAIFKILSEGMLNLQREVHGLAPPSMSRGGYNQEDPPCIHGWPTDLNLEKSVILQFFSSGSGVPSHITSVPVIPAAKTNKKEIKMQQPL